jgi:hypothetical protein
VVACPLTSAPFLNNCGDDPEGEMLTHWLGSVNRPNDGTPKGTLTSFNQTTYVPGGNAAAISMDSTGLPYTPPACASGAALLKQVRLFVQDCRRGTLGEIKLSVACSDQECLPLGVRKRQHRSGWVMRVSDEHRRVSE